MASGVLEIASRKSAAEADAVRLVLNSVVKNLATLAQRAFKNRWIVAYSGRTGLGKSVAVDYVDATLTFPHRLVRCKQATSLRGLVAALAVAGGESPPKSNHLTTEVFYARAVERARHEPFLLVIDEADRLRTQCFELLRDLWDDCRLPVLLVGNEDLEPIINHRHERLARRIRLRYTQPHLKREATREVVEFLGFEVCDQEVGKLWELVGGSPGWWEALLVTRNTIAESLGMRPGFDHLLGAVRYFPSLRVKE